MGSALTGGQPVALVVSTGVVADVIEVTKDKGHGVELLDARSGDT